MDDNVGRAKRCFDPYKIHKKVVTKFIVQVTETDQLPSHEGKWSCTKCLHRLKQETGSGNKSLLNSSFIS